MQEIGKLLLVLGVALAVVGFFLWKLSDRIPLGRLPGGYLRAETEHDVLFPADYLHLAQRDSDSRDVAGASVGPRLTLSGVLAKPLRNPTILLHQREQNSSHTKPRRTRREPEEIPLLCPSWLRVSLSSSVTNFAGTTLRQH